MNRTLPLAAALIAAAAVSAVDVGGRAYDRRTNRHRPDTAA